jgi:type I restriction enzyme S subunit
MPEWRTAALGELCTFKGGNAFPQDEQGNTKGFAPFIKVSDLSAVHNGSSIHTANNWVSEQQVASLKLALFPVGSSVFAKIGEGMKSERVRRLTRPTVIDNNLMGAIPAPSTNPDFLYFLLQTIALSSHAVGSALPYLKQSTLQAIPVRIPGRETQQAIAEVLGALDDKIAANTALATAADELVRAEYDALSGTRKIAIYEVADFPRVSARPADTPPDTPYVGLEHIPRRLMWLSEYGSVNDVASNKFVFRKGDTLFGKLRPYFHKVAVAPVGGICSTDILVVRARVDSMSSVLAAALSSDEVVAAVVATSGGTRMPRTSAKDLEAVLINWPNAADLDRLADHLAAIGASVIGLLSENQTLAETRDALLPQLMSGKLRVRDAERIASDAGA